MAMQTPDNKPRKYKETERFSIRRLAFWLGVSGIVYFANLWDAWGIAISAGVLLLTIISKIISVISESRKPNR
jgi:hypothetical protein